MTDNTTEKTGHFVKGVWIEETDAPVNTEDAKNTAEPEAESEKCSTQVSDLEKSVDNAVKSVAAAAENLGTVLRSEKGREELGKKAVETSKGLFAAIKANIDDAVNELKKEMQ